MSEKKDTDSAENKKEKRAYYIPVPPEMEEVLIRYVEKEGRKRGILDKTPPVITLSNPINNSLNTKRNVVFAISINEFSAVSYQDAINGKYNYDVFKPEWITGERFFSEKESNTYIKIIWSFGNNGRNYLFGKDIEEKKRSMHQAVVFDEFDVFSTVKYLVTVSPTFVLLK